MFSIVAIPFLPHSSTIHFFKHLATNTGTHLFLALWPFRFFFPCTDRVNAASHTSHCGRNYCLELATLSLALEHSGGNFLELGPGFESELIKTESNLACLDFASSDVGGFFPPRERRLLPNSFLGMFKSCCRRDPLPEHNNKNGDTYRFNCLLAKLFCLALTLLNLLQYCFVSGESSL